MKRYLLLCNDLLRLDDNPLLNLPTAVDAALAVCILPDVLFDTVRTSQRRLRLQLYLLQQFQRQLAAAGIPLLLRRGKAGTVIRQLMQQYQLDCVVAAEPTAPEEYRWANGLRWTWLDANSLLADQLRPDLATLPRSFTAFRQQREPALTVLAPQETTPVSSALQRVLSVEQAIAASDLVLHGDMDTPSGQFNGPLHKQSYGPTSTEFNTQLSTELSTGFSAQLPAVLSDWAQLTETGALQHFQQYLHRHLRQYKLSRNALIGTDFASFISIPLSRGTLSVRRAWQLILQHEAQCGQSESSYWLRFELLWREYFRHLQRKHPHAFFRFPGLGLHPVGGNEHAAGEALQRWQFGQTGVPFIDANMRLLLQTGWMSNRGRQNVASYLIFQLGCDWRLGAAWFEQQLLDYDVANNWGNWAYIAGGLYSPARQFNVLKQALEYDRDASFTNLLLGPAAAGAHRHQPYAQSDWPQPHSWQWQSYLQQLQGH